MTASLSHRGHQQLVLTAFVVFLAAHYVAADSPPPANVPFSLRLAPQYESLAGTFQTISTTGMIDGSESGISVSVGFLSPSDVSHQDKQHGYYVNSVSAGYRVPGNNTCVQLCGKTDFDKYGMCNMWIPPSETPLELYASGQANGGFSTKFVGSAFAPAAGGVATSASRVFNMKTIHSVAKRLQEEDSCIPKAQVTSELSPHYFADPSTVPYDGTNLYHFELTGPGQVIATARTIAIGPGALTTSWLCPASWEVCGPTGGPDRIPLAFSTSVDGKNEMNSPPLSEGKYQIAIIGRGYDATDGSLDNRYVIQLSFKSDTVSSTSEATPTAFASAALAGSVHQQVEVPRTVKLWYEKLTPDLELQVSTDQTFLFVGTVQVDADTAGSAGVLSPLDIKHQDTTKAEFVNFLQAGIEFPNNTCSVLCSQADPFGMCSSAAFPAGSYNVWVSGQASSASFAFAVGLVDFLNSSPNPNQLQEVTTPQGSSKVPVRSINSDALYKAEKRVALLKQGIQEDSCMPSSDLPPVLMKPVFETLPQVVATSEAHDYYFNLIGHTQTAVTVDCVGTSGGGSLFTTWLCPASQHECGPTASSLARSNSMDGYNSFTSSGLPAGMYYVRIIGQGYDTSTGALQNHYSCRMTFSTST